ncbi:hypothetical protein EVAR_27987_1 [Eumeta japonica]|uniref:Uncharacterized protein n=1 Tax=Eumeta variegata TaxID=151549 RepID=A0A4C1WC14_EUMVA|nr:hypothetical protein EVAR_27987_1 [Eumeta japonica]
MTESAMVANVRANVRRRAATFSAPKYFAVYVANHNNQGPSGGARGAAGPAGRPTPPLFIFIYLPPDPRAALSDLFVAFRPPNDTNIVMAGRFNASRHVLWLVELYRCRSDRRTRNRVCDPAGGSARVYAER